MGKDKDKIIFDSSLKFMDLLGNEIANPQPLIKEMNRRPEIKKIDYQAFQAGTNIGIVELWGRRETQEDRVAAGFLFEFVDLTEIERLAALENTVCILQDIIRQTNLGHQGSTFCSTTIIGSEVYTTNLGDGTAFLCRVNKQGEVAFELLNTRHNPDEPGESKRLKSAHKLVLHKRLGGSLAVSRALGDQAYEKDGLTHMPEIHHHHIKIPASDEAFIINACDGLMESDAAYYPKRIELLKDVLKANYHKTPNEIATSLALAAINSDISEQLPNVKVGDNISVMVTKIDPEDMHARYMLVCDGHGGDEVAEAAVQLYEVVIKNQILLAKLKDKDLKFVDLVNGLLKSTRGGKEISAIKNLYQDFNVMLSNKLIKNP